jgi:transcriptional regulator with XRE-family HTH domain
MGISELLRILLFDQIGGVFVMHNPQTVANVIKNTAQNKGVSVAQMLRDCGINKDLISTTQSKGYYPRVDALAAIADYLDVSVDYLLGRTDIPEVNR